MLKEGHLTAGLGNLFLTAAVGNLFRILAGRHGGVSDQFCVLKCPLFAPWPAAPASQQPRNRCRPPARHPTRESLSHAQCSPLQPEQPPALLRQPPPEPNLRSRHSLLTPHSPPPSQHLRA